MKNGLLLIDKPQGMTSHDVVNSVRRITSQKQVGHAGTLDPLATGLMVVLMGEATKLSDFILTGDKSYVVEALLGVRTNTGDTDGAVLESKDVTTSLPEIEKALLSLTGEFLWSVPIYSAVKVKGEKLYEKARKGEIIVTPQKKMRFYNVELISFENNKVRARLFCSKGSFIRVWVEKLGETLGCGATVSMLRRETSQPYSLDNAVPLDMYGPQNEGAHWVPVSETLPDWPKVVVEGMDEKLLKNGQISHRLARYLEIEYMAPHIPGLRVFSRQSRQLLAVLARGELGYSIQRIFNIS